MLVMCSAVFPIKRLFLKPPPPPHTHRRDLMASVLLEFSRTQAPLSHWLQETNHPQYLQTNSSSFSLWPALVSPPKPPDGKKLLCATPAEHDFGGEAAHPASSTWHRGY